MKAVGIIAEYNPLHKGHARLISAARERGDAVVAVMSGNFTQRGEAALLPPAGRAAAALAAGVNLVVELPFPAAAASARYFATAGVRALAGLSVAEIAFGSESGDVTALERIAESLPDSGKKCPDGAKNKGSAAAYFEALGKPLSPNDILAVEYLRANRVEGAELTPFALQRTGMGYADLAGEGLPSAAFLRERLASGGEITDFMPAGAAAAFTAAREAYGLADTRRLAPALLAVLRRNGGDCSDFLPLSSYAECGGGLAAHLEKAAAKATDYDSLLAAAATKRYTDARLRRALLFLLLGVRPADLGAPPAYLRLLAADATGRAFLAETRRTRALPVITKPSELARLTSPAVLRQRELSRRSDAIYSTLLEEYGL